MRFKGWLAIPWLMMALAHLATSAPAPIAPESVAILYNSADKDSRELAKFYAEARAIPEDHLIGIEMPMAAEISRAQYDEEIAGPLRQEFDRRGWWQRRRDAKGVELPVRNRIRVLVTMRGVPLKIRQSPRADGKPHPDREKQPFKGHDEASVDSELALLGVSSYPKEGALRSKYHGSDQPIAKAGMPDIMLTARIDAPTLACSRRMIEDAVAVEEYGLWGIHYIDISRKFPQGDEWLEGIVKENLKRGLPTVIDRFKPTLPKAYPMEHAATYYGWYDWNLSGPMAAADFRFRKGAVAIHIHSYSAQQLRDPSKNWSGGLLERGAAVTVGNVHEPYLGLTHHLDLLHRRLLEGHSWVEACWMALPSLSWQAVVLGDPLYRPFAHIDGSGEVRDQDREYRALREAMKQWGNDPEERRKQLKEAAIRMESGVLMEAVGLELLETGEADAADSLFVQARKLHRQVPGQLRQDLHRVSLLRTRNEQEAALLQLEQLREHYKDSEGEAAIKAWIEQLAPKQP
ncbi:MAG: TIGR03790 family protein [Akkermansiaceae bacterium]|nr:TIGR03790 family protein [Akkermansiaceae bacterium]